MTRKKFYDIERYNFVGLVFLLFFFMVSMLPSLLPRPWWLQGAVSGISMAVGYGLGTAVSWLARWLFEKEPKPGRKRQAWRILKYAGIPLLIAILLLGRHWQNEVRMLLGVEPINASLLAVFILSAGLFVGLLGIARSVRRLARKLMRIAQKKLPRRVGASLGIVSAGLLVYLLISGVLLNGFLALANKGFGARDNTAPEGIIQPTQSERSGSPDSIVPWEKIGFQGRGFVGSGPSVSEISDYNKSPAKEPIRVYAGLASADTAEARAELALAELKRTGAFDRKVLVVATSTGTGWLDPKVVDAIEFMHGGDTAIVSQQYSFLPSWISFLVDQQEARDAGRALYDTVIDEWRTLPADSRPKLIVYGLSLGSFGGQSAFSGINDIRRSTDGALFVGSPNDSEVWRKTTDSRDAGSPEWQPVYKGGETVRFASTKQDILADQTNWQGSRVLFVQHANDPVVWFSFDLIFHKPDWLSEPRGRAVSDDTAWYPVVTFLQVGLDQAIAASAPVGDGHYYMDTSVYAWAAVVPPDGWDQEKSASLQDFLNQTYYQEPSGSSL
ncbi:MAG: alpha/beta-hydrolase family protein [Candidatus Saccharimonadales bacterium]